MKQLLLLMLICFSTINVFAQRKNVHTLLNRKTRIGAYVSFDNQIKNFNNTSPALFTGGRVGMIFNRYLFVGFGGYGLSTGLNLNDLVEDGDFYSLSAAYGGLSLEPIIFPKQAIHLSFPLFAGMGGAEIWEYNRQRFYHSDVYFMYQGGANIELNMTKWFRVSGGIFYTETANFDLNNAPENLMNGLSYGLSVKLGRF